MGICKPKSSMLQDPLVDIVQVSGSPLDIPAYHTRTNAECDVIEFSNQLCSLPDLGTDVMNECCNTEWIMVVAIKGQQEACTKALGIVYFACTL